MLCYPEFLQVTLFTERTVRWFITQLVYQHLSKIQVDESIQERLTWKYHFNIQFGQRVGKFSAAIAFKRVLHIHLPHRLIFQKY